MDSGNRGSGAGGGGRARVASAGRGSARRVAAGAAVFAVALALVLLGPLGAAAAEATAVSGIRVAGVGAFPTVAAAIAAAPVGGVVTLGPGVYRETIVVDRPITLLAAAAGTVVDGGCSQLTGIEVGASGATVSGMEVRNVTGAGIRARDGVSNVTVDNNFVHDYDCDGHDSGGGESAEAGVAFWYAGAHQRVTNNRIEYRAAGPTRGGTNGIWFKSTKENPSGGGHYIAYNRITGGRDGVGGEKEDDPHGSFDGNTIIEFNQVRGCDDDGIQMEGNTQNSHVRDNYISGCAIGLANASSEQTGDVYFERNIIDGTVPGGYGNETCMKVGNHGTQRAHITGMGCRSGGDGIQQTNTGLSTLLIDHSVFQAGRYVFEFTSNPAGDSSFDYDCLGTTDGSRFVKYGSARYGSFAAFQAAGHEAHGQGSNSCAQPKWNPGGGAPPPPPPPNPPPAPTPPGPGPGPAPAPTPPGGGNGSHCFTQPGETGRCTDDRFFAYWQSHGGLAQQGYPITDIRDETSPTNGKTYRVQYFERARFEYHPELAGTDYEVLLGLLGREQLGGTYPSGPPAPAGGAGGGHCFAENNVCTDDRFFAYWQSHGGLAQQGLPLTAIFDEVSPTNGTTYRVQYFERARFEYHPENAGTAYEVLLGLLGREQLGDGPTGGGGAPPPAPGGGTGASSGIGADADAYVSENAAGTNYGGAQRLLVDGDAGARREALVHFTVPASAGAVSHAVLRFRIGADPTDGSGNGPTVSAAGAGWTEAGVNWNNRPAPAGGPLADLGPVVPNQWIEVDVSAVVHGPGQYAFVFAGPATDGTSIAARESGSGARLLLNGATASVQPTGGLVAGAIAAAIPAPPAALAPERAALAVGRTDAQGPTA